MKVVHNKRKVQRVEGLSELKKSLTELDGMIDELIDNYDTSKKNKEHIQSNRKYKEPLKVSFCNAIRNLILKLTL